MNVIREIVMGRFYAYCTKKLGNYCELEPPPEQVFTKFEMVTVLNEIIHAIDSNIVDMVLKQKEYEIEINTARGGRKKKIEAVESNVI